VRVENERENVDTVSDQFCEEFDRHKIKVVVFVARKHPLDGQTQHAPDEPGKERKNNGVEGSAHKGGRIAKSPMDDLIEDGHNQTIGGSKS
jgi:hypothetical protein